MKFIMDFRRGSALIIVKYFFLAFSGLFILGISRLVQPIPNPVAGEYFFSTILRDHYSLLTIVLYCIIGFLVGYFFRLNPWISGLCLLLIFPLTSVIEAAVYPGSHNLIPFEFIVFFVWALPSIAAVYVGKIYV